MLASDAKSLGKLPRIFKQMEREASAVLKAEGFSPAKQRHERSLAMRYRGQSFELDIKDTAKPVAAFHRAHRERYGYAQEQGVVEIVSARLRSIGVVEKLREDKPTSRKLKVKAPRTVSTYMGGSRVRAGVYRRDDLIAKSALETPCIVTEYSGTTLIPGDCSVRVDDFGSLIVELGAHASSRALPGKVLAEFERV
jgi:N-methylhydantoinase A